MRVAVVSDYLPGYHRVWSGAELIAVTLSDMLRGAGCESFFLTTPFDYPPQGGENGVHPVRTPLKRLGTLSRNFPVDLGALWGVRRALREMKPDIVHINAKYLFLPTMAACLSSGIPAVFTVPDYFIFCPTGFIRKPDGSGCTHYHGSGCYGCLPMLGRGPLGVLAGRVPGPVVRGLLALRAREFEYLLGKVSAFVVLSDVSRKRLVDYGIPEEKVRLIYHYRLAEPHETGESIEGPSAVFAGWLSEENGTDVLVRAFALASRKVRDARLYLVGTGKADFVERLKREAGELGVSGQVRFLGKRDNRETLSIISRSDAVVVPHQWPKDFGPVIVVEALALGKPVVTSRLGATGEFVREGVNGFLIDEHREPAAFAGRMEELLGRPEKAREMGRRARESVGFLAGDSQTREMRRLYESLLNGGI